MTIKRKYITKATREAVYNKYGGRCGYTGLPLESDWQVDHIYPHHLSLHTPDFDFDSVDNLMPTNRWLNNYKHGCSLDDFRYWLLGGLHKRLRRLPKNPKNEKSIIHKRNLMRIADAFGITPDKPFDRKFWYEKRGAPVKKIKVALYVSDSEIIDVAERIFGYEIMLKFLIKWPDGEPWQLYIRSLTDKLDQDFALRAIEYWLGHHPEMYMKDGRIGCLRDWEMEIFQMDEPDHKRITSKNCGKWGLEPVEIEVRP